MLDSSCIETRYAKSGELNIAYQECEVPGDKYSGIAVHLGARVASAAEPGQVLVTSTVKDLVVGSGIRFEDLGARTLKGVPEGWKLYRLTG